MKVFISSTYVDLIEYRKRAIEVTLRNKFLPLAMEYFNAQTEDATTFCDKEIRECDVFIGIYAHRYGYIPDCETKSITQREYELAKKLGKDCLCFIVDKTCQWPFPFIEMDKYPKLEAFLEEVKKARVVEFFKSPDDLGLKLSASLRQYIEKETGKQGREESVCLIPRAPYPYMAHPYALPEHFTGRRAEMAMLSNWFFNEKEPVLVLEAIGGMGKSALSWAWLHQEIIDRAVKVAGVFWWSFYDEPFESFIIQLYCYVTGKEATQAIQMGELMAALNRRRFLLVLDGLEHALRGYTGMAAMYIQEKKFAGDTHAEAEWDKRQRETVDAKAGRFLQALCAGNTKTLMTTRLRPASLEGTAGVKHVFLTGLSAEDTVSFFRSEGINGTHTEMEQAGRVYDFHPLMLKLLASVIKRSQARDITEAFSQNLIDQEEPHDILNTSFSLLSEEERRVATRVAVFRGVFSFDAVKALVMEFDEKRLWEVMQELRNLGFLFYDESQKRFDFQPILRSFLYGQLTSSGEKGIHDLAAQYFQALPKPQKVVTQDDLGPVIELFHHLVKVEKFDEACKLFYDRINDPIYSQLSAYYFILDLLKELFPEGENRMPRLKEEAKQAEIINDLACAYSLSAQPEKAIPLFLKSLQILEKKNEKEYVAIAFGNLANDQFRIGKFSASTMHFRKENLTGKEINFKTEIASSHRVLGLILAFQGRWAVACAINPNPPLSGSARAEEELDISFKLVEKDNNVQSMSIVSAYRSLSALLKARLAAVLRVSVGTVNLSREALHHARQALTFAEETIKAQFPYPRDFVQAYWLLGEALIRCGMDGLSGAKLIEPLEFGIPFYNEYFQQIIETVAVAPSNELNAAGRCLNEALRRCRTINLVESEPDILLALARLDVAQNKPPDETLLKEAFEIALRSGYRLKLADLHLFCGQVLLQSKDTKTLLGLTATEHLQKTKEYALDVSDISNLYSPVKTTADEFYKDIPEYEMLKRGMTKEERIQNGYWVAYQIAEILLNPPTNDTN